jgi:gas vesicle protein
MENRNNRAMMMGVGVGMVAGLAVGLAAGLLYAPRPGKETRAILKERAMEVWEKAEKMAEDMKELSGSVMQMAKEGIDTGSDLYVEVKENLIGGRQYGRQRNG